MVSFWFNDDLIIVETKVKGAKKNFFRSSITDEKISLVENTKYLG